MANKTYTAQEMRDTACRLFGEIGFNDPLVEHTVCKAEEMLRYAAEMVERCEDLLARLRPYRDEDVIGAINYILRGDAGKEGR